MFWVSLFVTASGLMVIWSFMAQSWTSAASYISAETKSLNSYSNTTKTDTKLAELLLS